ncbi:HET-domain-containing protein [Tothia fuscella]|uniref:HET-domain-containing protein n=1 Tax=Tothia fuscella TaxID=1048955 RepID=A0A9P4NZA6_9PEZI|nr:HET-domain-containing protein [Tothia fuscella]
MPCQTIPNSLAQHSLLEFSSEAHGFSAWCTVTGSKPCYESPVMLVCKNKHFKQQLQLIMPEVFRDKHSTMPRDTMPSRRPLQNISNLSPHPRQDTVPSSRGSQRQSSSRNRRRNRSNNGKRKALPSQSSLSGRGPQRNGREPSRDHANSTSKRFRHASPTSTDQLCLPCSKLCWNRMEYLMRSETRIDYRGKAICEGSEVEIRYRNLRPDTTCPLCRQLYAPWIQPFLSNPDPDQPRLFDRGDRIHIFKNLRHLPHMDDDRQSARNTLRANNAPYHIAVVPAVGKWKDELVEHIELRGMVVVMPKEGPESKLFVPQNVPTQFDRDVVLEWLKLCRSHKTLCEIRLPKEVGGMRVIDCRNRKIIKYNNEKYVTLSYVWGKRATDDNLASPAATNTLAAPQDDNVSHPPLTELPEAVDRTIEDAITVTKALGFHFLWVDQYCINQKDEKERQEQCSRMGDIYAGSELTIFALGENSRIGLPGLGFKERSPQQECTKTERYTFVSTMADPHVSIKESVWSTRGWTYQEGVLSTRRLFFTDHHVYFECNAMNCVETFENDQSILHTLNKQRYRASHRAGQFVRGNSNAFSHLNVGQNRANHRKIDTIRRCQHHIQEYSKRVFTNKDDILEAFAGMARFYAKTTARILSLSGITVPFPIAGRDHDQERLDHLVYALAWTHRMHRSNQPKQQPSIGPAEHKGGVPPWEPYKNPSPQRRDGQPSWSWAGWFGELWRRGDLPYCWTSALSSVRVGLQGRSIPKDFDWTEKDKSYHQYRIKEAMKATTLYFDAYVMDPTKLNLGKKDPRLPWRRIPWHEIRVYLSTGYCPKELLRQKLVNKEYECVVIGYHGEPRKRLLEAIIAADKKSTNAKLRRMEMFFRREPEAIVCLVVTKKPKGISERIGLLKILLHNPGPNPLEAWDLGLKRSFVLE